LIRFFKVPSGTIGWYILPFALGNFIGPLVLGPFFDTIGRKPMIAFTYAISGVLLAIVGYLFREDILAKQIVNPEPMNTRSNPFLAGVSKRRITFVFMGSGPDRVARPGTTKKTFSA
jgi:MFS family permease